MKTIQTQLNRRSFLRVSSAATGGLLIGFSSLIASSPLTQEQLDNPPKNWFDINAYIKIGNDGKVTIFSPNPEIGQNVKTSMPMIVAEELDVDWANVVVEQAGLNTDHFKRQVAGGSDSIRTSWVSLRMAGATARHLLLEAASQKWGMPISELRAENGIVSNNDNSLSAGYGELAEGAALLEAPSEVKLKNPKDFKIIGSRVKNVDSKKIILGEPLFGLDTDREDMLIAMIVHPPAFGQTLIKMNATKAKAMPGIKDVFTIDSTPQDKNWNDENAFHHLIAIVGESTWQVMKAKKALELSWSDASELENSSDHQKLMDEALSKEGDVVRNNGDVEAAFKNAEKIVESVFSAPFLAHNPLEPMNFFAHVTENKAELLGPVQVPGPLRTSASSVLKIPEENISVMLTRMGGGFGRRLFTHFAVEAALISQKMSAPVKLIYSREDEMTTGIYRPAYKISYKAGLDKKGRLIAWHAKGVGIPESSLKPPHRFPAGTVEHYKVEQSGIESEITTGFWRAPNSCFTACAEQSFIDEVAEVAGKDPIDFRFQLFDQFREKPVGDENDYDADRYAGVLELVREKSGWGEEQSSIFRGVSAYFSHNTYVAQVVDLVKEKGELKIKKVWCAVDCGMVVNLEGALNQVEGSIIDGIGHAMYSAMTFKNGQPQQQNFHNYRLIRHSEAPLDIETFFVESDHGPTGLGEPALPPIQAALANAMYKATGKRYYNQPFLTTKQS